MEREYKQSFRGETRSKKRPFVRSTSRREDNTKIDLKCWESVDWINLAPDTNYWWVLVNMVIGFRVP
jgi:hypothetical protein